MLRRAAPRFCRGPVCWTSESAPLQACKQAAQTRFFRNVPVLIDPISVTFSPFRRGSRSSPWRAFDNIENDLQQFRNCFADNTSPALKQAKQLSFHTDVVEHKDKYEFISDIPGVTKQEIDISIKEGVLEIRTHRENIHERTNEEVKQKEGKLKQEKPRQQQGKLHMQERFYGEYVRRFQLPEDVDVDLNKVKASYTDGVLKIQVPKLSPMASQKEHKILID